MADRISRIVELEPELSSVFEGADHVDVKTVDGDVSLRTFLAGMASYYPLWMRLLYAVRWLFVRLLGLTQSGLPTPTPIPPGEVPMEPGEELDFFTLRRVRAGRYWVGEASEPHLTAALCVVAEPRSGGSRFHLATVVHYHRWTGPVYFNAIRPFHHFVVRRMATAGVLANRQVGAAVVNIHERLLDAPGSQVGELIDTLSSPDDPLWPRRSWDPMILDRPLQIGARGGHGPIRYEVDAYEPGESVQFRFTAPAGFHGYHRFELDSVSPKRTWLRHILSMRTTGWARLTWPLAVRWLHDALLEDSLDCATQHVGATPPPRHRPRHVRVLVWLAHRLS